jgi:hypothetical protein
MAEDEDADIISKVEKKKADPEKESLYTVISYSKYAVGGESKVLASPLDENDNYIHRRQLNQPIQRKIRKNKYH